MMPFFRGSAQDDHSAPERPHLLFRRIFGCEEQSRDRP